MIRETVGAEYESWQILDLRTAETLPSPEQFAGAIVTGSASSVTDREAWTLRGESMLRDMVAAKLPLFGICYGHQMLGQALGGKVEKNPRGREIGTVRVEPLADDELLSVKEPYVAQATHVDSVVTLPPGACVLGRTALDPYAAVRFAEAAWGVQFHPEFDPDVMRDYIRTRADVLEQEGSDAQALLAAVRETPVSKSLLTRFVQQVRRVA